MKTDKLRQLYLNDSKYTLEYINQLEGEVNAFRYLETIVQLRSDGFSEDEIDNMIENDTLPKYKLGTK